MTPKFYGYLWIAFAFIAGLSLVATGFSLFSWVVLGFLSFGLIWAGMICVLPGISGHSHEPKKALQENRAEPVKSSLSAVHTGGFTKYRAA